MSKPGFTPGPWHLRMSSYRNVQTGRQGTHYWIEDGDEHSIPLDSAADPAAEANGRLIAAAPDLLAACEAAEEYLAYACDFGIWGQHPGFAAWQRLLAAVAKAKGGTQ